MARIDTGSWKEFRIADLFRMSNTKSIVQKRVVPDSGTTPYVTAQAGNNGVMTYVDCPADWTDEGGCILIGGKTLTFSYQAHDFCSNDSHNISLRLKDAGKASEARYLFLITALRASLHQKYSWGDSISMKTIKDDVFYLPVDASGDPDWERMGAYMSSVMEKSKKGVARLAHVDGGGRECDADAWQEFAIGDLFDVVKGNRLTKAQMTPGDVRFVGSSATNNGRTAMVGNTDNMHPANTITVCYNGSIGETFYQDEPFLASDDVNVLYPKFDMTKEIALFMAPLIRAVGARYSYVDKWKREEMMTDVIKLPVDASGDPDWEYMDGYMSAVMARAKATLRLLTAVA